MKRQINVIIRNRLGLHARAAAKLVSVASNYQANITLEYKNHCVNGKSILGVMMLSAAKGSEITLHATGVDASAALAALDTLIAERFGETS